MPAKGAKYINTGGWQIWRRRAKIQVKWCNLGDENTRFFHAMSNNRFRKNKIKLLRHNNEDFFQDSAKLKLATE
jgi:hypothetical protein